MRMLFIINFGGQMLMKSQDLFTKNGSSDVFKTFSTKSHKQRLTSNCSDPHLNPTLF